jgi:hypothetical protein
MKDTVGLLLVSIIPALLGILCIVIENVFPGHLYALKGIGVVIVYMLVVALPVAIKMTGKGNIQYIKWPTWL